MSKMTALLAEMEQNQLIGTEQRGGMWTTPRGNRIIAACLARKYRREAKALLGPVVFQTLIRHLSESVFKRYFAEATTINPNAVFTP